MANYKIAGLVVAIDNNTIQLQKELDDFVTDSTAKPDIEIRIKFGNIPVIEKNSKILITSAYINVYEDIEKYFVYSPNHKLVNGCILDKKKPVSTICIDESALVGVDTRNVSLTKDNTKVSEAEELLYAIQRSFYFCAAQYGRIPIHSASIIYEGKAWLFSAPSGMGKSTHVNMWHAAAKECNDFNGDVAMIFKQEDKVYAASLPWCGTSNIYCNEIVPLGGIIFLRRSSDGVNQVTKLSETAGVLETIARSFAPNWNRELYSDVIDTAVLLVPLTITAELYCTPTTDSVDKMCEFIKDYS